MDKQKKIILGVVGLGIVAAGVAVMVVLLNKSKGSGSIFENAAEFTKAAADQMTLPIAKPKDITNAGEIEFDYVVSNWSAEALGAGQPLIRIGTYPNSFEVYIAGNGPTVFRVGDGSVTEKFEEGKSWTPESGKKYHIAIKWSAGSASMYVDGSLITTVTSLDMSAFTSHDVVVFPPTAFDAMYSNIKLRA